MKMETEPRKPNFKGEGIAVWVNKDKNNQQYLSVKILGNINLKAWKNVPKPKPVQTSEEIQI